MTSNTSETTEPSNEELLTKLRQQFLAITDIESLAAVLTLAEEVRQKRQPRREGKGVADQNPEMRPVRVASLNYYLYHQKDRYHAFTIPKKNGQTRLIKAPKQGLKWAQRLLNECLQAVFTPREAAMGFVKGRSVVTNASKHVGRRFVFNLDLKDFFPSTHFGRVHAVLQLEPFGFSPKVAYLIANLCTDAVTQTEEDVKGEEVVTKRASLPQGAPTSPILTNLVCRRLDTKLVKLAQTHRCTYSRYADDLTFSSNREVFTDDFREQVRQLIRSEGYTPHPTKERLQTSRERQEVTGVVVNRRTNVPREYARQVRAMLHHWEVWGEKEAAEYFESKYDRQGKGSQRLGRRYSQPEEVPTFKRALLGKIEYLGMVRGKEDAMYLNLRQRHDDLSGRTARQIEAELALLEQLSE